jgi:predicted phage-related endonuclease
MVGKKTRYDQASCSTLPYIKGISQYQSRNEWLDTAIKASEGEMPKQTPQLMLQRMGDILEPVLCEEAKNILGLESVKVDYEEPVLHPTLPLAGSLDATGVAHELTFKNGDLDYVIIPEQETIVLDGPGVIECKATRNASTNDLEEWRGVLQAKGLMECTGYSWAAVIVLWQSTDFKIYLYSRKPEFQQELQSLVLDFDHRVKHKEYYPPSSSADANIVYKNVNKDIITLEREADLICEAILNKKEHIKLLNEDIDKFEVMLKDLIQDADGGQTNEHTIMWPMINYKAQPEKITPAKEARQVRAKTLRIKKYG